MASCSAVARLADPGVAGEQHQPSLAAERVLEQVAHLAELGVAAHEDAAGEALERVDVALGLGLVLDRRGGDRAPRLGGALRAVVGRLREQVEHDAVKRRGDLRPMARRGDRLGAEVLADDRHRVLARKRRLTGDQLVEHRPERVEVRASVGAAAERLLGRQVGDRSDEHPLDRGPRAAVGGEAEVAEARGAVVAEPDVGGLQVAVDDPACVGVLERPADVDRDRDRPLELELAPGAIVERPLQVAAADVLADDERNPAVLAGVEHADDVRMLAELAHRERLAPGAGEHRLRDVLGVEHGDRDVATSPSASLARKTRLRPPRPRKPSTRYRPAISSGEPDGSAAAVAGTAACTGASSACSARVAESCFGPVRVTARRAAHARLRIRALESPAMSKATLHTNAGPITVDFFDDAAPKTVENFRKLASDGFYDGLTFHRVISDFMIQGGCPEGTGTGGPGYTFEDEFNDNKVVRGALAMANAGPNTNGSQFFIVTIPAADWLDGKHTVFGEVVDGMDVVDAIEGTATGPGDRPLEPQVIERIELSDE